MASVLQGTLFLIGLMSAAWTDLRRRQIYDLSGIVIAGAGLISFSPAHLFGLLLAVPFFLASGCGRGGAGDTMLIAAASLSLGFFPGLMGLAAALLLFLLFALTDRLVRKAQKRAFPKIYPLAPFLAVGFIAAYFMI